MTSAAATGRPREATAARPIRQIKALHRRNTSHIAQQERDRAIFCQPEIGFGFFPGGGLERLPLVTGRSRAMEIITGEDFDAELDAFTDRFATRVASFDRLATKTAKEILNTRSHVAAGSDQAATNARFLEAFARP